MRKSRASASAKETDRQEKSGIQTDVVIAAILFLVVTILIAHNHTPASRAGGVTRRVQEERFKSTSTQHYNSERSAPVADTVNSVNSRAKVGHEKQTFTLINSFWADTPGSTCVGMNSRRKQPCQVRHNELLGAMRANMLNPALAELFVLYEARPDDGCKQLEESMLKKMPDGAAAAGRHAKFSCTERSGGQPTYEELFQVASSQPDGAFLGNIVIVSNADVVFDHTLSQMPPVGDTHAYALSVNTKVNKTQYLEGMGQEPCEEVTKKNGWTHGSKVRDERCPWKGFTNSKGPQALSFDAYAFKPPLPDGWIEKSRKLSPLNEMPNKLGMENRAKCGLEAAGLTVLNACLWVRMFHYHKCAWYSHPMHFVAEPNPVCDRATYPCMLYSNTAENPLGAWGGAPVVDASVCTKANQKKKYTANAASLRPQEGDWKGPSVDAKPV